jgi:site-specific recombinase XerD
VFDGKEEERIVKPLLTHGSQHTGAVVKPQIFLVPPDRIGVRIPYEEFLIGRLRNLPGGRWECEKEYWSFPRTREALEKLLAALRTDWHQLDHDVAVGLGLIKTTPSQPKQVSPPRALISSELEAVRRELRIRNYSPKTMKAYRSCIRLFADFFAPRHPRELSSDDIRRYILHQIDEKKLSAGTVSQTLNALRFLYAEIYKRPFELGGIKHPKKSRKLPVVLSLDEVKRLFESVGNLKHRVLLMLAYSAGLRVGEIVRLKPEDIDSQRKLIRIQLGKGRKDRYTILSDVILDGLREYWKAYRPKAWLFEGKPAGKRYSERSAQKVFEQAAKKAGIRKRVSIHSLRHSFATHLLEQGTDIRFIQELLGHRSVKTTEIYTHVSRQKIAALRSPIDTIIQPREK